MTKEHLLKYLREPKYLNQISYQELKTLVAEHPSSLSLRYLLALKSKQENNGDYQRQLEFLGIYSIDRGHFFEVFTKEQEEAILSEGIVLQEDYLELKELSTLERELGAINRSPVEAVVIDTLENKQNSYVEQKMEVDTDTTATDDEYFTLDFEEEMEIVPSEEAVSDKMVTENLKEIEDLFKGVEMEAIQPNEKEIPVQEPSSNLELQETLNGGEFPDIPLEVLDTDVEVVETNQPTSDESAEHPLLIENEELTINPIPKTNFSTWFEDKKEAAYFNGFDLVGYNSKGLIEELIQKNQVRDKTQAESVMDMEEGIASETLAQLLVLQGHYAKAKSMYEQLKLIYPEKIGFFAAEIQRIENLEEESALKE